MSDPTNTHARETTPNDKRLFNQSIQDYLSLGYLFLLILGISRDAIYYGFNGINILAYSNVQDVLLSPLVYITSKWLHALIIGLMVGSTILLSSAYGKRALKKAGLSKKRKAGEPETSANPDPADYNKLLGFIATLFISFFLGSGIGSGLKVAKRIHEQSYQVNRTIAFEDGEEIAVYLIGQNSDYIFYVKAGESLATISPIRDHISSIQKILPTD